MSFPSPTKLQEFDGALWDEFAHLYAQNEGYLRAEHKADGSHGDVTAESVTVTANTVTGATGEVHADGVEHDFGTVQIADDLPDVASIASATGMQAGDGTTGWAWFSTPSRSPFSSTSSQREWDLWDMLHPAFPVLRLGYLSNDFYLLPHAGEGAHLGYNGGTSIERWLSITTDAIYQLGRTTANGAVTAVSFSAGNFTASGSMTWTVASGDQTTYAYWFTAHKILTVSVYVVTSTIGGTPSNTLKVAIPGGYTANRTMGVGCLVEDNGTALAGFARVSESSTVIDVVRHDGANFSASADNAGVRFTISFEVQ